MNQMRLTTRLEIKSLQSMQFEGHGSVFGNVDLGDDVILPGAFTRSLAAHKSEGTLPAMFWMHNMSQIPGKWIDVSEDEFGLPVKGELAPTELGKEVHTLLKMDAVRGLSIGYIPTKVDYNNDGIRLIKEVDLYEISIVSIPMNPKAQIAHVKSRLSANGEYVPRDEEIAEIKRECERFLRHKGFSKRNATAFAANLFSFNGATPLNDDQNGVTPGKKSEVIDTSVGATPDEIELNAGISEFRKRQIIYDLDKHFAKIFS